MQRYGEKGEILKFLKLDWSNRKGGDQHVKEKQEEERVIGSLLNCGLQLKLRKKKMLCFLRWFESKESEYGLNRENVSGGGNARRAVPCSFSYAPRNPPREEKILWRVDQIFSFFRKCSGHFCAATCTP